MLRENSCFSSNSDPVASPSLAGLPVWRDAILEVHKVPCEKCLWNGFDVDYVDKSSRHNHIADQPHLPDKKQLVKIP